MAKSPKSPPERRGGRSLAPSVADDEARTVLESGEREFADVSPFLEGPAQPEPPGEAPAAGLPGAAAEPSRPRSAAAGRPSAGRGLGAQAPRTGGLQALLDSAREPGVYFAPDEAKGARSGQSARVARAVEQAARRLSTVRGVQKVSAGTNADGGSVVLIAAEPGFTQGTLDEIPEEVDGVPTLLVLPFELLPLKATRR